MKYTISKRLNRALAYLIDILIFIPVMALQFLLVYIGYYYQIIGELVVVAFELWYFVYYVYRNEKTFGKSFENIKILSFDGSRITLKQVFIRYLGYSFIGLTQAVVYIGLIIATPSEGYDQLDMIDKFDFVSIKHENLMIFFTYCEYLYLAISTLFVFFHKDRRSLPDFLAGTIVVEDADNSNSKEVSKIEKGQ